MTDKPRLVLGGDGDGRAPSFEDICAFHKALTGLDLTDDDRAAARADYDAWIDTLPEDEKPRTDP